jgi:predicted O-methyltransferase YrrM
MFGLKSLFRRKTLVQHIDEAAPSLSHEDAIAVFGAFCRNIEKRYREDNKFFLEAWTTAERHGLQLLAAHYYSPIATADEVLAGDGKAIFDDSFGIRLNADEQLEYLLQNILPHARELQDVPFAAAGPGDFSWTNGMFDPQDSTTYYGMIRQHKPRRVMEVGSGFSTLVASMAARANRSTKVQCIEPYPTEFFNRHLTQQDGYGLIRERVQDVGPDIFRELEPGDILFIDSSHVVKPSSDVEYLIFKVLPVLRPGVFVHFHDIFMPRGYHPSYYLTHHWYWNENYVLAAFLSGNPGWKLLLANNFLGYHGGSDQIARAVAKNEERYQQVRPRTGGSSLWLQKQ